MIRAREDDPLDPRQRRGVKHVRQSVKVRPDQIVPGCEFVGIGRQVNDRVDPVEVRDPFIVQDLKISHDGLGIVRIGNTIDQHKVVDVRPRIAKLAADIATRTCDENRARLFLDRIQQGLIFSFQFVVYVGIEHVNGFLFVDRQMRRPTAAVAARTLHQARSLL